MRDRSQIPDYYSVLGIGIDASQDELRKAWRAAQKQWHPDRNPTPEAAEKIRQINAAWEVLGDPEKRAEYDSVYFTVRARIAEEQRRAREAERLERERRERLRQQELERKMRAEAEARRRAQEAEDRRKAAERRRKAEEQRERKRRERAMADKREQAIAEARRRAAEEDKRDRERRRREEKQTEQARKRQQRGGYRPPGQPVGANAHGRGGRIWWVATIVVIAIVATIATFMVVGNRTVTEEEPLVVVVPTSTRDSTTASSGSGFLEGFANDGQINCPSGATEPTYLSSAATHGQVEFDFMMPAVSDWSIGVLYHLGDQASTATYIYGRGKATWLASHWTNIGGIEVDAIGPKLIPDVAINEAGGFVNSFAFRTDEQGTKLVLNGELVLDVPLAQLRPRGGPMVVCVSLLGDEEADYRIAYSGLKSWSTTATVRLASTPTPLPATATPVPPTATRVPTPTPKPSATPTPDARNSGELVADSDDGYISCPSNTGEPAFVSRSAIDGEVIFSFRVPTVSAWSIGVVYHDDSNANSYSGSYVYRKGAGLPVADHWTVANGHEVDGVRPRSIPFGAFNHGAGSINHVVFRTDQHGSILELNGRTVLNVPESQLRPKRGRMRLCVGMLNDENAEYSIEYYGLESSAATAFALPTSTRAPIATATPTRVPTATPQPAFRGSPTVIHDLLDNPNYRVEVHQVIALLVAGAPVNAVDSRGRSPLDVAAIRAHSAEVFSALTNSGADASRSPSVLHLLFSNANYQVDAGQVAALLAAGAPVNVVDSRGLRPLDVAAGRAHSAQVLSLLATYGADASRSPTVLHLLFSNANYQVDAGQVAALLVAGAEVNAVDSRGLRPLDVAAGRAHSASVFRELVNAGADASQSPTVLHRLFANASYQVDAGQVASLIAAGSPVNAVDSRGLRPLDVAAGRAHSASVFRELANAGADANRTPTALHRLLSNPSYQVDAGQVSALIAAGASLTALDNGGRTPLDIAASRGHNPDVMQLLTR